MMMMKHIKTTIKYIYVYIQGLLFIILNNKWSWLYFVGLFIIWGIFNTYNILIEHNINYSEEFFKDLISILYSNKFETKDFIDINKNININPKLDQFKFEDNYPISSTNLKYHFKRPLEAWTNYILGKDKTYFPSYFQKEIFNKNSSVLNHIPIHINWSLEQNSININLNVFNNEISTIDSNIISKNGIKGKVTLTELKQIQKVEDNKFILSTYEQYKLIEEKLQSFILERENKSFIINNINNGTELWYPLNSGEQMQDTITELIDPAIKNLSEMKNNILKEIKDNK